MKINNIAIRAAMLVFWLGCILLFLYLPSFNFLSKNEGRSINIYCWVDVIDPETVKQFEEETGIKVNIGYYEQNFELFSKLELTQGKGYDLVMLTDFAIKFLVDNNLVQPIDKTQLTFWPDLEPAVLDKSFDRGNIYSIPYLWDIYVIGYRKSYFSNKQLIKTLDLMFNPLFIPERIVMVDEASEAFSLAAQYAVGSPFDLSDANTLQEAKKALLQQKKFVEAYFDLRAGSLLLSGSANAAICQSAFIYRAMQLSDDIGMFIPQPRAFAVIDGFVITKKSQRAALIYQFLNYIYQKNNLNKIIQKFSYLPPRKDQLQELDLSYLGGLDTVLASLKDANFFSATANFNNISRLWTEVKAY